MPKLTGLFDDFTDLDLISVEKIREWLHWKGNPQILENRLGNRILYPYGVPVTPQDLEFDLALLREVVKFQPQKYFDVNSQKIVIPARFLKYVPDLPRLARVFIDGLEPEGVISLLVKSETEEKVAGTLIRPQILDEAGEVRFRLGEQKYEIGIGSVMSLPAFSEKVEIGFVSESATLQGKKDINLSVSGGSLGVIIDTRMAKEGNGSAVH